MSPRSQAKASKEHYLMENKVWGFLCTLCGNHGMDSAEIKAKPCFPLPEVGSLTSTPALVRTPQKGVNDKVAEEQVLRAELAELEEQEKQLALLLELQQLHEQEAALLAEGLDEREAEALRMATALSLSEAEARERMQQEAEENATEEPVTVVKTKLASTFSAENIAAEMLDMKAEPNAVVACSLIAVLVIVSVCCHIYS